MDKELSKCFTGIEINGVRFSNIREMLIYMDKQRERIAELEQKISILLSCKNCPENKGGFICQKEYEDKCLSQKIQYIKELQEENNVLAQNLEDTEILNKTYEKRFNDLEKENAELRAIAENQQSSNMSRYFENKKLKEGLAIGSVLNKGLNSLNKALEEERDKYRNMVFDKDKQLTKAKEIIKTFLGFAEAFCYSPSMDRFISDTEQFISEVEK